MYVGELVEIKNQLSLTSSGILGEELTNIFLECELKTVNFIFLIEKIFQADNS